MANIVLIFTVFFYNIAAALTERKCDNTGIILYEDMACPPTATNQSTGCPIEFKCPNLRYTKGECYYKNITYKVGDQVNHPDTFCDLGCSCLENGKFGCAILECAEYFGFPPNPGCYRTYDLKTCCSNGQSCDQSPGTCKFEGQTYHIGERFYPKTSCSMCVCQKGFRGEIEEPFCTPRKCNVELKEYTRVQEKCAPLYEYEVDFEKGILCCPGGEWICPNGSAEIIGGQIKSGKIALRRAVGWVGCNHIGGQARKIMINLHTDKSCEFGNQSLKVGQTIERDRGSPTYGVVICECKVPPLLTCIPKKHYPMLRA